MRKPESSTPANPATLIKPQVSRGHLKLVSEEGAVKQALDTNLGRRRVPRRAFESPIGLLSKGSYEIERAFQVGEGGMMLSSVRKLVVGEMVVVSFYLPTSATIVVRGVVRSVVPSTDKDRPARFGVEFMNLGFQFKREIRNFVASATSTDAL